jgi:hypothetical protein
MNVAEPLQQIRACVTINNIFKTCLGDIKRSVLLPANTRTQLCCCSRPCGFSAKHPGSSLTGSARLCMSSALRCLATAGGGT